MLWDYDNDLGIQLDFNVSDYVTDENVGFDLYEEGDCEAHHIQCRGSGYIVLSIQQVQKWLTLHHFVHVVL